MPSVNHVKRGAKLKSHIVGSDVLANHPVDDSLNILSKLLKCLGKTLLLIDSYTWLTNSSLLFKKSKPKIDNINTMENNNVKLKPIARSNSNSDVPSLEKN